ncbi:helix-turn-helix domain-containing protein [Curtobacterium oceanosedimentum]|uniref:helix-turn-helix domain-containing protein n=1 Tax=Curtobacterium oceanosedimentum TaxID=465820 RepID=UPI003391F95F
MQNNRTVADTVRAEVARKGLTSKDVAAAIDRSRTAAYRRMYGEVPFTVEELRAVATLVGCTVSYLLGEEALSA